ncbi:MAG TPA: alpha/beta hydrolase [Anaerolineales bacterium]|nr:alpha/beta hydrolase [Anaerolineales bacterium]
MTTQKIGDIDMYFEITGEGEPILFLHGLGSSVRDWESQIGYFSRHYQVIVVDVRGHGKTDKPPGPYSIPLFARDVSALLKALETGPAHVVGISMGGMVGFQLAVDAPEIVKSLAVVNSGPEMVVRTFKERLQVWQRFLIVRLVGMRKMGEVLSGRLFPKPEQERLRTTFIERWAENDPRAYRDSLRAIVGWSVSAHLEKIACPVLVIAADQDYTPVEAKASYLKRLKQGEMVVIDDSRHATPVERPDEFNEVLMGFLKKH